MSRKKVLLVGESWVSASTHFKGFDYFNSVTFHLGAEPLVKVLEDSPFELTYMTGHEAPERNFPQPWRLFGLRRGASLRHWFQLDPLHPDVWLRSKTFPTA